MTQKDLIPIICSWFILLFSWQGFAQPTILWEKSLGGSSLETAHSLKETSDNGFIMVGSSFSSNGNVGGNNGGADCWLVRCNSTGQIIWEKNYGGEATDIPFSICTMSDGGFIFVGLTYSTGIDVQGNHGDADIWVVKIDSLGSIAWQKCLGGSQRDVGYSVEETIDGGLIICGETNSLDGDISNLVGITDVWLIKLSKLGQIEWERCFGGSNGMDIAYQIHASVDGGYVFLGETSSSDGQVTDQHGNFDIWLAKVSNEGALEWQKTFGGSYSDRGWDIEPALTGGFYIVGYAGSPDGDIVGWQGKYDYWVIRISNSGEILWQRTMGGTKDDFGYCVFGTKDGGCVVSGATNSVDGDVLDNDGFRDVWVVRLDSTGQVLWQKTLGGSEGEFCKSIVETNDGGYLLACDSDSNNGDVSTNQGSSDFWIVKLAPVTNASTAPTTIPLHLYPNPAQNWFRLNLPITESDMHISITDAQGRVVVAKTIRSDERLDISALEPGVYSVTAVARSGQVYAGKLVKG
jgi:hypothetical protein